MTRGWKTVPTCNSIETLSNKLEGKCFVGSAWSCLFGWFRFHVKRVKVWKGLGHIRSGSYLAATKALHFKSFYD